MDHIVEEALSNSLILGKIFSFLNEEDLEACCNVSTNWREVADPMVFSHFYITLGKEIYYVPEDRAAPCIELYSDDEGQGSLMHEYRRRLHQRESDEVVITERARYNRKIFTRWECNISDLNTTLENLLLLHKVSISLKIRNRSDDQEKCMKNFLSKFGPLVVELKFESTDPLPFTMFCTLLLKNLPNLRKLNCSGLKFEEDAVEDGNFNPDLPENKHKHLRNISFKFYSSFNVQKFVTTLKIAPHLDEIQRLPLEMINALEVAGMGHVLKSLEHSHVESMLLGRDGQNKFQRCFQTLVRLQPNLAWFQFLRYFPFERRTTNLFDMLQSLIFSILESSSGTLQTLHMPSAGLRGFHALPRFEVLKRLEFGEFEGKYEGLIFPANISLARTFPNVSEIRFLDSKLEEILNRLPEDIIIPWGFRITFLRAEILSLDTLLMLQPRFPFIEELQFSGSSNQIAEVLPYLAVWPYLKSLGIRVNNGPGKLNCTLTGLSEEILDQLGDSSRRGNFTNEEIQRFKDESPMKKLKELRKLKLILTNNLDVRESVEKSTGLSAVVNEFSFKLLPLLKVTVGIPGNHKFGEGIQTALEPLPQSDNIQIEDYCSDGGCECCK